MSVKKLFEEAPKICGAKNASKHSTIANIAWEQEKSGNHFQRIEGESARDRIEFLFDWECENEDVKEYCIELAELNVLAHYGKEHGDAMAEEKAKDLAVNLAASEYLYPEVSSILTVEAAASGWWGE